jgi:hypothetical protein
MRGMAEIYSESWGQPISFPNPPKTLIEVHYDEQSKETAPETEQPGESQPRE